MNRYLKIILFFLITFLLPVGIHFSLATAEVRETESYDVVYSYCDDIHFLPFLFLRYPMENCFLCKHYLFI